MGVTIKDIAAKAGVSHTTVSRAMNDSPLISLETKERIKQIAQEMNYVPNLSAKGLVTVHSYNVGVFFSSLIHATSADFIYTMIKTIGQGIHAPYNVVVNGLDTISENCSVGPSNFDGIILVSQFDSDEAFIQNTKEKGIPLVVINRKTMVPGIQNLYCDETSGVAKAVEFLWQKGHRDIGYIEGDRESASNMRRKMGYEQQMKLQGAAINPEWVRQGDFSVESGYQQANELMKLEKLPTAVICASDAMAIGAMRGFAENGLKVPEDISVIGFDNGILADFSLPSLTSIGRPLEKMGFAAAEILMKMLSDHPAEELRICYDTTLYPKESVKVMEE